MEKTQAQDIIKNVFENKFDKAKFTNFIIELLNVNLKELISETAADFKGKYIPETFNQYIDSCQLIGKYESDNKLIDILVINLKKETSLDRARTMQRNFVAWYLKHNSDIGLKDAALAAFVSPDSSNWRFSLIKMDYDYKQDEVGKVKIKEELTPAKRWSFLVGENENSHTAQSQLVDLLADENNKPNLKNLEDAFNIEKVTKEFFKKYTELFNNLKDSLEEVVASNQKVKSDFEKKSINPIDFSKKLLGQIVFLYFLQKKGWFGVKRDDDWGTGPKDFLRRLFKKEYIQYDNFFNDVLEPLFYEALRIDRSYDDDYLSMFKCKIPFLNGGLFDPINNYDWVHTDILLPNELFSNKNKTKEGDIDDGILGVFDRYNFTVKEDEPLEKEVAVDPEMLGKVFENLLEVKDRKSKGTYYTPREIVHYMCQQSLINYLATELENIANKDEIENFVKYCEQVDGNEILTDPENNIISQNIISNAKIIDDKLAEIKVCDPAVGSGAFLVGMMSEIVRTRTALNAFLKDKTKTAYNLKRGCIENSLYGVDIDPGAVEIAKLRLWLSLVVDEDDIKQIKPLPNLDYKIVCGNSLLGVEKNLFNQHLFSELELNKKFLFNEVNPSKKQEYKKKIDELIFEITNGHKEFDFEIYFSEVFHEKDGFDVVIGNPPYVEHKKLKNLSNQLKNFYSIYSGTADLYVYFYEMGINILKNKGILTYISSNKFIKTSYGEKLREFLSSSGIQQIIDFTKVRIFNALVASCILIVFKNNPSEGVSVTHVNDEIINQALLADYIEHNRQEISSKKFSSDIWQFEDNNRLTIKVKIEEGSKKLGKVKGVYIYRGITTGYNSAFLINEDTKNELISYDKKNMEVIKPLLQGRNIKKWFYNKSNHYLLQTGFNRNIKSDFPHIYSYLSNHKKELEKREDKGRNWWNLRACKFYNDFEKEKIIWGLTADKWAFAYDINKHYLPSNGYILISEDKLSIKYLIALLNSDLLKFYFGFIGIMTAGGAYTLKHKTISALPIKETSKHDQKLFIEIVDKILTITNDDDYLKNFEKQAKVKEYESQIDQMVYKLYSLTDEEIKIVKAS